MHIKLFESEYCSNMGGNHSTHVANAYPCDIWVKCDAEKSYVLASNYSADVKSNRSVGFEGMQASAGEGFASSGGVQLDWHKVQTDFSRVGSNEYLRFDVPLAPGTKVVYISVFGQDGRLIANGLQRYSDLSIIVTRDGYIRDTEYGSVWKDTQGRYHR